jgi:hypothetical protein
MRRRGKRFPSSRPSPHTGAAGSILPVPASIGSCIKPDIGAPSPQPKATDSPAPDLENEEPAIEHPQAPADSATAKLLAEADVRLLESAAVAQSLRAELVRAAAFLQPGESISCEPTPTGGFRITRHPAPAFVGLKTMSSELPDNPTPQRIERLCKHIHCRVVQIGKTPAVAREEFNRKLLEDAERRVE